MFGVYKRNGEKPTLQEEAILRESLTVTNTVTDDYRNDVYYCTSSSEADVKKFVLQHENWKFFRIYATGLRL